MGILLVLGMKLWQVLDLKDTLGMILGAKKDRRGSLSSRDHHVSSGWILKRV